MKSRDPSGCSMTSAGIIEDGLMKKVQLLYQVPPEFDEPSQIPLGYVKKFHRQGKLVLYSHGYIANPKHDSIVPVFNGLMAKGEYNVVAIDWSAAAKLPYPQARGFVGPVGRKVYEIVSECLRNHNIPLANVTCIGHSLGAHVCGNFGKETNGDLEQIMGLDPAAPLISFNAPDCLRKTDAKQVVNIHTGAYLFGQFDPLGDVDVYSHYGTVNQPGCIDPSSIADFFTKGNACSHNRACQIGGEGITSEFSFPCVRCDFTAIKNKAPGACQNNKENKIAKSTIQNDIANQNINADIVYVNLNIPKDVRGTFITETNSRAPFGKGASYRLPEDFA